MTEDYRAAGAENGADSNTLLSGPTDGDKQTTCINPWKWFWESPLKRYPFAIFCVCGLLTVMWVVLFLISGASGSTVGAFACLAMACYGAFHFKTLLALREQVDKYRGLNVKFKSENAQLNAEVSRLQKAEVELQQVEQSLTASNKRLKDNVEKFRKFEENLQSMNADTIKGLAKIQQVSKNVAKQVGKSLVMHEKTIYTKCLQQFKRKYEENMMSGLNQAQFLEFWQMLPPAYYQRFQQMGQSFAEVAGPDLSLSFDELMGMVEKIAQFHADSGGSQT